MTDLERRFLEVACREVGSPYIWGGKGTHLHHLTKGLIVSPFLGNDYSQPPLHVFDCSGLVTWAQHQVLPVDNRGKLNAQMLFDYTDDLADPAIPHLRFYGRSDGAIVHVAIAIAKVDGKWFIVDASGGDSTVTTIIAAQQRGAQVRCHFEGRTDLVGTTILPLVV